MRRLKPSHLNQLGSKLPKNNLEGDYFSTHLTKSIYLSSLAVTCIRHPTHDSKTDGCKRTTTDTHGQKSHRLSTLPGKNSPHPPSKSHLSNSLEIAESTLENAESFHC